MNRKIKQMNKKQRMANRLAVWKRYHMKGMGNYCKRAKNAIYFSPANGLPHETMKAIICYRLLREKKWFITEAVDNSLGLIRDIVCLDDGKIYEIETNPKRAERFKDDPEAHKIEVILI